MDFINDVYILDNIIRYSTVPTIRRETVASHSFFVAAIVLKLSDTYNFNVDRAVTLAVCHDMGEIELNDLPRGIADKYPGIKKAYKKASKKVLKKFPKVIGKRVKEYEQRVSIESLIVKLADAMQCLQKAKMERKIASNKYMREVEHGASETIQQLKKQLKEAGVEK